MDTGQTKTREKEAVYTVGAALSSPQFVQVRRRIFRQLIESLIFEGIVEPHSEVLADGECKFTITGRDIAGENVSYQCTGRKKMSFGRIRLSKEPVRRGLKGKEAEADCLTTFLSEISPYLKEEAKQLPLFTNEIQQTLLKDTLAQYHRQKEAISENRSYDDLEGDVMDGHPYHPCYKSRMGFDLVDNQAYGPDFKPRFKLIWMAIQHKSASLFVSRSVDYMDFIKKEMGNMDYAYYTEELRSNGFSPEEYVFLPVHPWQWREKVVGTFIQQIRSGQIVILGEGSDEYSPQQSIRTLANRTHPEKSYVKLPLSITNTSASRILGTHHVENAPVVSDWLGTILDKDRYLKEKLRLIFLKEVLGIVYNDQKLPEVLQQSAYGSLGAIWRESVYKYLDPDEEAIPFTAISHLNVDGRPFIASWVGELSLEQWVRSLLQASVLPLIHLLYVYGIAMESHAQNMVLVHRKGIPVRVALKDFPGGIRYYTGDFVDKSKLPDVKGISEYHSNQGSSMETEKGFEVRDFLLDGFFHINLGELSMFLEEHFGFEESSFWSMVAEVIHSYQEEFPNFEERFSTFDLFEETIEVGQLTIRRLCGESKKRDHFVKNPLYHFIQGRSVSERHHSNDKTKENRSR
jgi:siderophore synthetase component